MNKKEKIQEILRQRIGQGAAEKLAQELQRGSENEIGNFDEWLNKRFLSQLEWLSRDDYARALIRALWLAPKLAGTDFGSSRQRDFGQVWTDAARGFMGEIAVKNYFQRFGTNIEFDTSRGDMEKYLPSDIMFIQKPGESSKREARLKVSVKTTKFNGRWLDIPGKQFDRSDVFVLVKLGICRTHLLSFLKAVSFLRDKLFAEGNRLRELDDKDAEELWNEIPDFEEIPAYISGYIDKASVKLPIDKIRAAKKGKKNTKLEVQSFVGMFSKETLQDLREQPEVKRLDPTRALPVNISNISITLDAPHFLADSGSLKWGKESWERLLEKL